MNWIKIIIGSLLLLLMASCANRAAGPTGGDKDSIPPVVLRSVPVNGAINYTKKELFVYFNENVTLDKVTENFIISPPQEVQPVVKANAKVLHVTIEDELLDSTTYSLFFGNAIVDLNEKNPLENYQFAFSTGPVIDTLQVSGKLYDAFTLDPVAGIFVGLHASVKDSAMFTDKFVRVTKTDEFGKFTIKNIKEGSYTIYALGDANRDFMYQPGEAVAFYPSAVVPEVHVKQHSDTLWTDSVTIDTIQVERTISYVPDTIVMSLFKEDKKRQYLVKTERREPYLLSAFFNRSQDSLPVIQALNFPSASSFLVQANQALDSINWWIPDSSVYLKDTLLLSIQYMKTDSLFNFVSQTDTLKLAMRRQPNSKATPIVPELKLSSNLASAFDLNEEIRLKFDRPVQFADTSLIELLHKKDTLLIPVAYSLTPRDSIGLSYAVSYEREAGESYEMKVDSAAFTSIYQTVNKAWKSSFKLKTAEDYSSLKIVLAPYDSLAILQVIDAKESVIQEQKALEKGNLFEYLQPGDYYVKLFIDANQNGKWDPGDLLKRRYPEKVLYYKKSLSLKANWELEESWDIGSVADPYLKPDELDIIKKKQPKEGNKAAGNNRTR